MPEDRFRDLDPSRRRDPAGARGPGEAADGSLEEGSPGSLEEARGAGSSGPPSLGERLAELDSGRDQEGRDPPSGGPPPARPGPRYAWVVGVVALIAIIVAAYNSLVTVGPGEGIRGPEPGTVIPDFAAPSATGESDADANVRQGVEGSDAEGTTPACAVVGEDVVNICELRDRPVVVTFVVGGHEQALDQVERVREEFPGVQFVGVISGESREDAADLVGGRDWGFPVALDPDGAVLTLYRIGDSPATVFAEEGGEAVETVNGFLEEDRLRRAVERIDSERSGGACARCPAGAEGTT